MLRAALILAFVWSVAPIASGQNAQATFDAASVKKSTGRGSTVVPGVFLPDGRWSAQGASLSTLLRSAYALPADRIVGLPSWAHAERFDIVTTPVPNASAVQLRAMAQQLLIDRFGFRAHWDERITEIHALVRVNPSGALGQGLRPAAVVCQRSNPVAGAPFDSPRDSRCVETIRRIESGAMQFKLRDRPLNDWLIIAGAGSEIGTTIVDRTGLEGRFDLDVEFVYRSRPDSDSLGLGVPLTVAVVDQLGLRFDQRRETVPVLVIDSVERPTPD